uniref:Sarcoglycan delta n=1 Tax=Ovis aries TaxID=9940 RepID=A0AC11C9H6_SHEEP
MPQEQYTHHRGTMPSSEGPQVYKVGIYGWRKRCLYFFVLLLMILILVNLAMTIWILKVMNFTIDGMGNLRITEKGLKLEGDSEFLQPLYAKEIQSRPGNALYFKSARNVTVNILNEQTKVLTQLITGPKAIEAYGKKFEVKTVSGKLLFSADNNEVVVGAERLRVLGAEGTVFPKSIETPNVRADPFKELSNTARQQTSWLSSFWAWEGTTETSSCLCYFCFILWIWEGNQHERPTTSLKFNFTSPSHQGLLRSKEKKVQTAIQNPYVIFQLWNWGNVCVCVVVVV